ncbi:hypothetical protein WICMUC_000252 [Wickerhamomyces mucosus]|uniref:Uncharacterized protein n=1 Tax=Wickerhamomyces mucosus TaxID=1378264 RepID=A0A9P8PY20_9ASCO|nr:hypothetical protein WICMUC_000252 [Wickerhamomyces mucosus]
MFSNFFSHCVAPSDAVTTQKSPPPAPVELDPLTPLTPVLLGSISQGNPLHLLSSSQVILNPKLGSLDLNGEVSSK